MNTAKIFIDKIFKEGLLVVTDDQKKELTKVLEDLIFLDKESAIRVHKFTENTKLLRGSLKLTNLEQHQ